MILQEYVLSIKSLRRTNIMEKNNIAIKLEEKRKELVEFITLHDSDMVMKKDYVHIERILDRFYYISKHYNGDIRIQKLDHGSVDRFSHIPENLYFDLVYYPPLFQKILEKAGYDIHHIAEKGKDPKTFVRLTDIAYTTEEHPYYEIKPDFISRLCSARDLLKIELKREIEDLTNEIEGGADKEELQLSSFKLEDKVIVVTEYIDHDMFWIKDILKADMKLNISADSSNEEEIETAMRVRVADMYLDEMIQDAISKNNKEREELLKAIQPLPADDKVQWLWQKMKINIAMTKIDKKLD